MRRIFKYLLLVLTGLLALVLGGLGILTGTESGSRWLVHQAVFYVPGELQVAGINGRLISGLTLTGVDYRLDQTELRLRHLELRWRAAALLHGTLRIQQLGARDVHYRAPAGAPDTEPFTLPERIALPFAVRLDKAEISGLQVTLGSEQSVVDEIVLSARAGPLQGLVVKQLEIRAPGSAAQLSGKADLHQPYAFNCNIRWHAQLPDAVPANGQARLAGDLSGFRVDHTLSRPFHVTTGGSVRLDAEAPVYKLSGHWQGLRWPFSGSDAYTSAQGEYTFEGTLDAYRFTLNGPLEGPDIPAVQVRATGSGDLQHVDLQALDVTGLGGSASATGRLAWAPLFSLGLNIRGTDIDPGQYWPGWPGRLKLATRLDISTEQDSILVAFHKLDLQGVVHGRPLAATGELALRDGVPGTTGLAISSGRNRIRLSGVLDAGSGLRYKVTAPELSALLPGLAGQADASGVLKGPLERLAGSLELTARELAYAGNSIATLTINAQLDPGRPEAGHASLHARTVRLGTEQIDRLTLESRGWLDRHEASLQLASARGTATVELNGSYRDHVWEGRLGTAAVDLRELGDWRLREPVPLRISAGEVGPFRGCWASGQREVCLRGEQRAEAAQLALSGKSDEGHMQADIDITRLNTSRPAVAGKLSLGIPDIRFINPLLPDVTIESGQVTAEARLAGYLDSPEVTGSATLENGLVKIPELGLELNAVELQAQGNGTSVALNGTAHSGEGNIGLAGDLRLDPQQAWPFNLGLKGERFAIAHLPDADMLANPDLQIRGSLQQVNVSGSVLIPHARITLKQLPPDVVKVSADQVIVGPAAAPAEGTPSTVPVSVNVIVTLGDDVRFEGLGLSTDLAGTINVRSLETHTLIGNGVLELTNGRYEGYGQKLAIQRGRLLFAGPLDNPALDVRATRTAGDVTAGIELSGTVDAPQTRLFSDPAMSDAEILSYLVTGKPLSAASSGSDSQALAAAAATLGANSPVAAEISDKLGIDVGVESGTTDAETSVVVGKQLSPQLRVEYLYGMFTASGAIQFVYKLTRHLSLAGQSGMAQSIDLRYTIDRP